MTTTPRTSNPGAPWSLYLNFDDQTPTKWSAYSVTASTCSLTTAQRDEVFYRIAEYYAPLTGVSVTTVKPPLIAKGKVAQIIFQNDGSWYGGAGGVAYVGGALATTSSPNTGYVFCNALGMGPFYIAGDGAHEAGHLFGLQHQSIYSATGVKVTEYLPNDIMGSPLDPGQRPHWAYGTSTSAATYQDDLVTLAKNTGGVKDDYADSITGALQLQSANGLDLIPITGVITSSTAKSTTDVDVFKLPLVLAAGRLILNLTAPAVGAVADLSLSLLDSTGKVFAEAATGALGELLSVDVTAGQWYGKVSAAPGSQGNVGSYGLGGRGPFTAVVAPPVQTPPPTPVPPVPVPPTPPAPVPQPPVAPVLVPHGAPSNLVATKRADGVTIDLAWTNTASDVSAFDVDRSINGGPMILMGSTFATHFNGNHQDANKSYRYQVRATGPGWTSAPSNTVSA